MCLHIYIYIYIYIYIEREREREREREKMRDYWVGIVVRVFANVSGDQGSILGWVLEKTKKMLLDASLLDTWYYKIQIKDKWSNPVKEVVPSPIPWCNRYWKGNLQVTLFTYYIYIYIYIYITVVFNNICIKVCI